MAGPKPAALPLGDTPLIFALSILAAQLAKLSTFLLTIFLSASQAEWEWGDIVAPQLPVRS
jgi:hypothetical protein